MDEKVLPEITPETLVDPIAPVLPDEEEKTKIWHKPVPKGFICFLVAAISFLAGFQLNQRLTQPASKLAPEPQVVLEPTPTPDPTATWETYTNTDQKWGLNYPSNWETEKVVDGSVIFRAPGTSYQEPTLIVIAGAEMRVSLLPWKYSGDIASLEQEIGPVSNSDVTVIAVDQITVAGQTAAKIISKGVSGKGVSVSIPRGTEVFQVTLRSPEEIHQDTFSLILSTFRFLGESDEVQIREVLDDYIPKRSLVKVFELEGLKIVGSFAKVTVVPKNVVADKTMVILEKNGEEWKVIWGPGTAVGKTDPILEKIPAGLLE